MNIVIVDAQVVYSSINYNNDGNNDNFSVSDDGTHVSIYSGQPDVTDKHAMDCTAQVLMRGGGNDCRLGLTKMRVGWLQNGVDVDKTAYYNAVGQPGMTFYYALPPFGQPPKPVLDCNYPDDNVNGHVAGTGKYTAFTGSGSDDSLSGAFEAPPPPQPTIGYQYLIFTWDSPNFNFPDRIEFMGYSNFHSIAITHKLYFLFTFFP